MQSIVPVKVEDSTKGRYTPAEIGEMVFGVLKESEGLQPGQAFVQEMEPGYAIALVAPKPPGSPPLYAVIGPTAWVRQYTEG